MTKIPAKRRHKAATVHVNGKDKFPIDSRETAKNALKLENSAKPPLTPSQRRAVEHEAASFGVRRKQTGSTGGTGKTSKPKKK